MLQTSLMTSSHSFMPEKFPSGHPPEQDASAKLTIPHARAPNAVFVCAAKMLSPILLPSLREVIRKNHSSLIGSRGCKLAPTELPKRALA